MRRHREVRISQLQVAALTALLLAAALLLILSRGESRTAPGLDRVAVDNASHKVKQGKRGKRGRRGFRGPRGDRGPVGPVGPQGRTGRQGVAAGPERQFIAIDWQNNDWQGKATQRFVAPGIGEGEVRCIPPTYVGSDKSGTQTVQFWPYDSGTRDQPPRDFNTSMWTTRSGGNDDDPNEKFRTVVRRARIDRDNQLGGFHESMNTNSDGLGRKSTGSFTGIIVAEPRRPGLTPPPPTTFQLSWHFNFSDEDRNRCYVAGSFVSRPG